MLDSLRNAAKTWVAKLLLLLLMASFAVWGISGQIFGPVGGDTVIAAGDTKVSAQDYRLAYDRQLSVLSQQVGQRITREQAQLFGIDRQVLSQLVGSAVLDEQASAMNLGLSQDRLAGLIAEDPAFQGLNGRFDRRQFTAVLRDVGMREQDYIVNREKAAVRQQIVEAVSDGLQAPKTLLDAIYNHQGQTRDLSFIDIDASALPAPAEPDDSALAKFFEDNKSKYRAPEYRDLKLVRLTTQDIVDTAAIPDADVRAEYDGNPARYTTPERRTIQQLVFADKAAATVARERILAGDTFENAVTDAGKTLADVTLGTFVKEQVPDQTLADAAFALASTTEISPVIDGAFGPILVRVSEIQPSSVEPFESVSDEIRQSLALVQAKDVLLNVHDAYEDARASGKTMDEAAGDQKLKVLEVKGVDSQGKTKDGANADLLGEGANLLPAAFEAETGAENPPVNAGTEGFLWYEVTNIEPERDRTLDEVRDRVIADWKAAETEKALDAEAERIAKLLRDGGDMQALATENNYRTDLKFGLERRTNDPDFGADGVATVFEVGPNGVATTKAATGNRRLVFKVTSISAPVGDASAVQEQDRTAISRTIAADLMDQLVNRLQSEFPVTVNQTAMQQAIAQ